MTETIYLDNGATSFPKAPGVGQAMARYIDEIGANINRGTYQKAMEAASVVLDTRQQLARLMGFAGPDSHVVFTPGATAGLNLVLQGFLHEGDHVIVSSLEHNAVMRPLHELSKRGVSVSRLPADAEGITDVTALTKLVRPETKLVLVNHVSNVSGSILPLAELAERCCEQGLPLAVDASQSAGHLPIAFDEWGLAALCLPAHKGLLGPQGLGAVLLSEDFAPRIAPLITGGTGSVSDLEEQPPFLPDCFESGTQNLPGIFGWHAALKYLEAQDIAALRAHELELTERFIDGIVGLPLRIVGPKELVQRTGVVSVDFSSLDNAAVAFHLENDYGILTRCGLQCAPAAHRTLGTFPQGTVRFSFGYATTQEDVAAAVRAISEICC